MIHPPSLLHRRPARILLVEDDDGDALLTQKALATGPVEIDVNRCIDAEAALACLVQSEDVSDTRPDLILLDLNLPGMHGWDFLDVVKADKRFRRIPVVVLTSSKATTDVLSSYDRYANTYMIKPGTPEIFKKVATSFEDYWFRNAITAET